LVELYRYGHRLAFSISELFIDDLYLAHTQVFGFVDRFDGFTSFLAQGPDQDRQELQRGNAGLS
jgi:hypothetical protein